MTDPTKPIATALNASPRLSWLIAAMTMLGPFSIDTYLPSFPEIGAAFSATPMQVQQTLTAYLVPFALMSLWHGAISDALGRRRVLLVTLALFVVFSVGCALAWRIEVLWLMRAGQGLVCSAGVVLGRAMVRDLYEGDAAQRVMSQVAVLFAIAPAIAPVIGGWLHEWFGWRSVFVFLTIVGIGLWVWSCFGLPETLPPAQRRPLHPGYLAKTYLSTLAHGSFMAIALAAAFNFSGVFLYITSAPVFLMRDLGVSETGFFWLFGPVTAGMMLGAALAGRFAGKLTSMRVLMLAYGLMSVGAICNVGFHLFAPARLPWSVLVLFIYACGMSMSLPILTLLGLDLFPAHRGLAASCQAFVLLCANAITAGVLSPILSASPLTLALGTAGCLCCGILSALAAFRRSRAVDGDAASENSAA